MTGRLIDADSLIKNLSKWMKQVDPTHPSEIPPLDDMIVSTIMTVEEEPTVDAIPITFIWDFMNHIEEEIAQTDDSDPRMAGLCARHNALNALLRAWKEEGQE